MIITLKTQHGKHMPGSRHEVVEVVPHGGYTDSAKQYVLEDRTFVASDNAEVVPDEAIDYRLLLVKYMNYVGEAAGTTYVHLATWNDGFTEADLAELRIIDRESNM
jgi:hypothetical protein